MKSGLVLVNKKEGMTSFDCIRVLKKLWQRADLGHGGTLDRFATGLLPIMAGEGLKLARFFMENHPELPTYWKSYAGVFEFGRATETGDPEGETIESRPATDLTIERISEAMQSFIGVPYEQMPPKFSAKKIGGERSSDLARKGKAPELKAVPVTVRKFNCTHVKDNLIYFEVECSKGTYVRALAMDLARKLDTVGHVKALCRLAVGGFSVSDALTLEQIEEKGPEQSIMDMNKASSFLPDFPLIGAELDQLRNGKTDGVVTRLANSGLAPNAYRAMALVGNTITPIALLELVEGRKARFLRAISG